MNDIKENLTEGYCELAIPVGVPRLLKVDSLEELLAIEVNELGKTSQKYEGDVERLKQLKVLRDNFHSILIFETNQLTKDFSYDYIDGKLLTDSDISDYKFLIRKSDGCKRVYFINNGDTLDFICVYSFKDGLQVLEAVAALSEDGIRTYFSDYDLVFDMLYDRIKGYIRGYTIKYSDGSLITIEAPN